MFISIGIVGLPNVGKSTLFQLITKKQVDIANYPFCTIEPNIGVVAVPDERIDKLAELFKSAKKIYTTIKFYDIAGLVKGASRGEGLGNKFLANIRETDAIVFVLRAFKNEKIINVQNEINILKEKEILETELILKDLETVEKRINNMEKETKGKEKEKEIAKELEILKKAAGFLTEGKPIIEQFWTNEERKILNNYQLLTMKPKLYLLNGQENDILSDIKEIFKKNNWVFLIMDILNEFEAADLKTEDRLAIGLSAEPKIYNLIKESYKLLDLITFFTTGPDETRAWTLKNGSAAPQAGGAIHSDFEKYFIKAEVINWQELLNAGGFSQAKEKGLIRIEGKEYFVKDGDVIEIKSRV